MQGSSHATAAVWIRFPTPACGRELVARSRLVVFFGPANVTSRYWDCRCILLISANNEYFQPSCGKSKPFSEMAWFTANLGELAELRESAYLEESAQLFVKHYEH